MVRIASLETASLAVRNFMEDPEQHKLLLQHPEYRDHEKVIFFSDETIPVKGFIAINNTNLGPALGGCRLWPYAHEDEALTDVLRLSRGMTYKAALANLNLGGGKAVLMVNPDQPKTKEMFEAFGKVVHTLGGEYITAEDVATSVADMQIVRQHTPHVVGLPMNIDEDNGDPSPYTAYGVYQGICASVAHRLQSQPLHDLTVAVQGLGNVGMNLCQLLHDQGARLVVTDLIPERCRSAAETFGATVVPEKDIFATKADVFAPCALGGILNPETIAHLQVSIVAGAANNQLLSEKDAYTLKDRHILYAPDYAANAGGLIRVVHESADFQRHKVREHIDTIYTTLLDIFEKADAGEISTHAAANHLAEERFKSKNGGLRNMEKQYKKRVGLSFGAVQMREVS